MILFDILSCQNHEQKTFYLLLHFVEIIEAVGPGKLARWVGLRMGLKEKYRNTCNKYMVQYREYINAKITGKIQDA